MAEGGDPPSPTDGTGGGGTPDATGLSDSVFELGLYRDLNDATDLRDFEARALAVLKRIGFTDYVFIHTGSGRSREAQLVMLDQAFITAYCAAGLFEHDLVRDYAKNNTDPIFASMIEAYVAAAPLELDVMRQNREMFRLQKHHGYYDFYVIPFRGKAPDGNVMFLVGARDEAPKEFRERVEQKRVILHVLAETIDHIGHMKFDNFLERLDTSIDISIRAKPLRLLQTLVRDDLTLNQAAKKLGVSVHTANQHIAAAKKSLNANTMNGAIYKAIRAGLIDPKE